METTNINSIFNAKNKNKWFKPLNYYSHSYNSFDMRAHSHDRIEIMYVTTGEIQFEYQMKNGSWTKTSILPSNYVFIDADVPHKISVNGIATTIYNIELSLTDSFKPIFTINELTTSETGANSFFTTYKPVFISRDDGTFLQNLLLIQKYIGNNINDLFDNYLNYQLSSLVLLLIKQYNQAKKYFSGVIYLNTAVSYIYENYNRDITLTELASICKISPNYLNTLFKKDFGTTVKEYVNKYRITRAILLLTSTTLPIDEIRVQIGYNNKISFNQNFVKYVGKPPRTYRREMRGGNIVKTHKDGALNTYLNV
jgi:AraC-like DNA-binding protein